MAETHDLYARKAMLQAVEAEIAERTSKFEDSIADLRREHERLRREYADALRAELAEVDAAESPHPHLGRILAAIERGQQSIVVERIRELGSKVKTAERGRTWLTF